MESSVLSGTMANMTYQEIEKLIQEKAVALFPIAVIEEHGPHLPLGTDTYLTFAIFKHIQDELNKLNIKSVIVPPFYWGINCITNGFPGSFTVKVDTMKAVLKDTIECLHNWGFNNVYVLNVHGDYLHSQTLLEIVKEIYESSSNSRKVYDIVHESFRHMLGVNGSEPYVLIENKLNNEGKDVKTKNNVYLDTHAGSLETSLMLLEFNELVDEDTARKLQSSKTTFELFEKWLIGGSEAKEITPLGYCGDPANIDLKNAQEFIDDFSKSTARLIANSL